MAKSSKKDKAQKNDEKVTVFYHAQCVDGAAAAYAAHMKYGDDAKYIPMGHKSDEDTIHAIRSNSDKGTHVIFADYAPTKNVLDEIIDHTKHVSIFDHHTTTINEFKDYEHEKLTKVLDPYLSGGAITFDQLHGDMRRPQSIELAQMVDMGRFGEHEKDKIHNYEIAAYMDSIPNDRIADIVTYFKEVDDMSPEEIAKRGEPIRRIKKKETEEFVQNASYAKVQISEDTRPIFIPMINAKLRGTDRELDAEMRKLAGSILQGVAMCWHEDAGKVHVSIRSIGAPDAESIATYLGSKGLSGGGHETSAGCHFNTEDFNKLFPRYTREEAAAMIREDSIEISNANLEEIKPLHKGKGSGTDRGPVGRDLQ